MTAETRAALVAVAGDAPVLVVHLPALVLVAGHARERGEAARVRMAAGAGDAAVVARGDREEPAVVEVRRLPRARRVARLAAGREAGRAVVRVRGAVVVVAVAGDALAGRALEAPAGVALRAVEPRVGAGQREAGE